MMDADFLVTAALLDLWTGNLYSRQRDREAFERYSVRALGFILPYDWTGQIVARHEEDRIALHAQSGSGVLVFLDTEPNANAAEALQLRLKQIHATAVKLFQGEMEV